jgi:hypothetical protein
MSDNLLLLTEGGDYLVTESGEYIIAVVQYQITSINGTYTVAGQTANLLKSKVLSASYGTYSLTGQNIVITHGYEFLASNGLYSLTGNDATITYVAQTSVSQLYVELRSFTERRRM